MEHAARVADALKAEPGVEVEIVDGGKGEFTVTVGGRTVARKGDSMPSVEDVRVAVRRAAPAPVGARA